MNSNPTPQKTRPPAPIVLNPATQWFIQAGVVLGLVLLWWSQTRTTVNLDTVESDRGGPVNHDAKGSRSGPTIHYRIDLNNAGKRELQLLPGVGEITAAQILDDRRDQGPFESIDDLARVAGVGEKTIQAIRPYCEVKSPLASDPSSTRSDNALQSVDRSK